MTATVANVKQGLVRRPTYSELIKEIDRERFKTNDIRKVFDRNAWYYHDSPLNTTDNTSHPADIQQMNFKKMAEEATARKEEALKPFDVEDISDLRDDAISDFELSFDKEREMREENERRVAEQTNLSHSQDHYMANKGTYDAIGATASAGIKEDEPSSSNRSTLKNFLKSSKPLIKAVATAGGTAKGGSIGGLIAEKLTDAIIPDKDEPTQTTKIPPVKKTVVKKPRKTKETGTAMKVDVAPPPEPTEQPMNTSSTEKRAPIGNRKAPAKRLKGKQPTQEKREFDEDPSTTTKPPPKRTKGKQPSPQPALQSINIPKDNKTPDVDEAPKAQEETQASSSTKTPVKKPTKQVISPSKVGIQVIREKFEEMNNRNEINPTDYKKIQEVYTGWKNSKGLGKKEKLKEAQQLYKTYIYPKLKAK